MKTLRFVLFLAVVTLFLGANTATASVAVTNDQVETALEQKVNANQDLFPTTESKSKLEIKLEKKLAKKMAKIEKRLAKKADGAAIDFNDPVDKWMWFWIFGWAAGLVLWSIGWWAFYPLAYVGSLCWVAGTVCLIIWLLKKSGNM